MTDTQSFLHKCQFGLMNDAIDNIFQTRNSRFYQDTDPMENQADILALVLQSMKKANATFIDSFDRDNPELDEMWLATGKNGTFITHFTYHKQYKADRPADKKSVFLAGRFVLNEEKFIYKVDPFYYLQGSIETPADANGHEVFFPLETGCRTRLDGQTEDSFTFAFDINHFVQMLCYGRKAFERILTGQDLSVSALESWLDEENVKEADKEYFVMQGMKPQEFEQMIAWERAVHMFDANASFVGFSAPARN